MIYVKSRMGQEATIKLCGKRAANLSKGDEMSGDTQAPGEKIWAVREVSGKSGWSYCVHGHVRFFYARTRKDAKEQFIKGGYKQFESTHVTAVSEGD